MGSIPVAGAKNPRCNRIGDFCTRTKDPSCGPAADGFEYPARRSGSLLSRRRARVYSYSEIPVAGAKHAKRRAFFIFAKVGIPLRETLGEGGKLACDGNFTPLLILFPKTAFLENLCPIKPIDLFAILCYNLYRQFYKLPRWCIWLKRNI